MSDYNTKYLQAKLGKLTSTLQLYSYILSWALAGTGAQRRPVTFLEYGGGLGILSLLAKESNVGVVVYNDIYDVSCSDAEILGSRLEAEADHYVVGDIDDLLQFLSLHQINCDAVGSYDVIEHVYDIRDFFRKLPAVSSGHLTLAMASGANPMNPFIRMRLMKRQLEVENKDQDGSWGQKERDNLKAYRAIRAEIVRLHLRTRGSSLSETQIEEIAVNSRGMIASDIRHAVDNYLATGDLPEPPPHPTNTCDPITGNWAEHLLDPRELVDLLSGYGFAATIRSGYFGSAGWPVARGLGTIANLVIGNLPDSQKLLLAPFYMICGERNSLVGTRPT